MNRFLIPATIFLVLAGVLFIGVRHSKDKGTMQSVLVGRAAPNFTLPVLGDPKATFSKTQLDGKPWVLNVWGTWCVACRDEHETLVALSRQGVLPIVGLDWKDDDETATQWLTQLGNPYSVVVADREGRTAIEFGVYGAPETFFIDATGHVQYRHVGPMTDEVWRREFLGRVVKENK